MENRSNSNSSGNQPGDRERKSKSREAYCKKLDTLSERSIVGIHFHPDTDIDWDNPENEIRMDDDRWILGDWDNLGATDWYKDLPREEKIRVGLFRVAHTCMVGAQFEKLLIAGLMPMTLKASVQNPESEYILKESGEEINHILMFQEFVKRTGIKTKGAPRWFRRAAPALTPVSNVMPVGFMTFVLAGEEPIDHMQQTVLKQDGTEEAEIHPLLHRIMKIHVTEEARHISFAKAYLERHVQKEKMTRTQRMALSVMYPLIMRLAAEIIMKPSKKARNDMGIPKDVAKEVWWDSEYSQQFLRDLFPRSRKLADDLGLRDSKIGRAAWRWAGIDNPNS